jgi:hypothetical protein
MMMRGFQVVLGLVVAVASASAVQAYENYIPLGTGYSANVDSLPSFDSEAGQVSQQTDVYETEIYLKGRKRIEDESRMRAFFSDAESTGADSQIDY